MNFFRKMQSISHKINEIHVTKRKTVSLRIFLFFNWCKIDFISTEYSTSPCEPIWPMSNWNGIFYVVHYSARREICIQAAVIVEYVFWRMIWHSTTFLRMCLFWIKFNHSKSEDKFLFAISVVKLQISLTVDF